MNIEIEESCTTEGADLVVARADRCVFDYCIWNAVPGLPGP